jgi:hypothetical protein
MQQGYATIMQPTSLKALANKVLERNRQCNHHTTKKENQCNFSPEKTAQKLHRNFIENQDQTLCLKIEPMDTCLHGKKCRYLDAPGGNKRPACRYMGKPVFDMSSCPLNRWARQQSPQQL